MNDRFVILMAQAAIAAVKSMPQQLNVISIGTHPNWVVPEELCKNRLLLNFEDLDTDMELHREYKYPQKQDILDAIDFGKKYRIHIIHCTAGLSRSPAIGYAILRSEGYSKEDALKKIVDKVPAAIPNKRMVKFADEIFNNEKEQ